jgi:hypothetical protein
LGVPFVIGRRSGLYGPAGLAQLLTVFFRAELAFTMQRRGGNFHCSKWQTLIEAK